MRADAGREDPQLHPRQTCSSRTSRRRGRLRPPGARRRARGRDRHHRHARLRRHAPPCMDVAVPELRRGTLRGTRPGRRLSAITSSPRMCMPPPLIGLLGAAEAGITTVVDWSHDRADDGFADAALQAHADAGLRTVFVDAIDQETSATGALAPSHRVRRDRSPRLRSGPPCPEPRTSDPLPTAGRSARDLGLRIHAHADPGTRDRRHLRMRRGRDSWEPMSRSFIGPGSTTPTSTPSRRPEPRCRSRRRARWRPASASPPIQQLIDHDIRPGLGIDNERDHARGTCSPRCGR